LTGHKLHTDIQAVREKIIELGSENILGILSTTSCFAPRVPDDIIGLSKICKEFNLFHLVNNAYGLQCKKISNLLNQGNALGRIDAVV
jgi:O-phospho-L-seryl-tRNASec:L-selenocysteinyl-tRNA synthase